MKETHLRRLLFAAASFLGCLVHGKDHTLTITSEVTQSVIQSVTQSVTESVTESVIQSVTQSVIQSVIQSVTQSVTESVTQTVTIQPLPTALSDASIPQPAPILPQTRTAAPPALATNPVNASQGEVFLTIALQQAALASFANALGGNDSPGVITLQTGNAVAIPSATGSSGSLPRPTETAASSTTSLLLVTPPDPAQGGFLGGNPPSTTVDLPLTILFLLLFIGGAVTHISIYRANAKRGHKFLLSDLMFDFCMVRTVTCIFRIIWVFVHARGVVLAAQIFFNGG